MPAGHSCRLVGLYVPRQDVPTFGVPVFRDGGDCELIQMERDGFVVGFGAAKFTKGRVLPCDPSSVSIGAPILQGYSDGVGNVFVGNKDSLATSLRREVVGLTADPVALMEVARFLDDARLCAISQTAIMGRFPAVDFAGGISAEVDRSEVSDRHLLKPMLNTISWETFYAECFGDDAEYASFATNLIFAVQDWLFPGTPPCWYRDQSLRIAPAATTRAETQLLSISEGRFAIRLYINGLRRSFINLRRSCLMSRSLISREGWSKRVARPDRAIPGVVVDECAAPPSPRAMRPIADGFLEVPRRFADKYRTLTRDFHSECGEASPPESGLRVQTTAYVQLHWMSGVCSHACVIMAELLLQDHIKRVDALPEIAAAFRRPNVDEVLVTALSPEHIASHLGRSDVGLNAYYLFTPTRLAFPATFAQQFDPERCFHNALKAYLLSGMPVIKHLDMGRMHGVGADMGGGEPSIYERNRTRVRLEGLRACDSAHAVLLVGASPVGDDFLLHDPALLPYLEASSRQLALASSYVGETGVAGELPRLTRHYFQPVTPGEVRMPLHTGVVERSEGRFAHQPGMFALALALHSDRMAAGTMPPGGPSLAECLKGEFRLVRIRDVASVVVDETWSCRGSGAHESEIKLIAEGVVSMIAEERRDQWSWVQRFRNSFWIWDAERALSSDHAPSLADAYDCFVAMGTTHGTTEVRWSRASASTATDQSTTLPEPAFREPMDVSLISSCCTRGVMAVLEDDAWPEGVRKVDLYTFMRGDVRSLLLPGSEDDCSAVEAMARIVRLPEPELERELVRIARVLGDAYSARGITIRAFASFISELSDTKANRREVGRQALLFLCRLARSLQDLGHHVTTIELVAGSQLDGIGAASYKGRRSLLANWRSSSSLREGFLDELRKIAPIARMCGVRFAIEAEPGVLFAVSRGSALYAFIAAIRDLEEKGEIPEGVIGVNLDVGHWILCGLKPEVLADSSLADRVYGVHISGHFKAHLGDAVIDYAKMGELQAWADAIRLYLWPKHGRVTAALELEAAPDRALIRKAVDMLRLL
jgi:sugar phosphate isomerase/epimerase